MALSRTAGGGEGWGGAVTASAWAASAGSKPPAPPRGPHALHPQEAWWAVGDSKALLCGVSRLSSKEAASAVTSICPASSGRPVHLCLFDDGEHSPSTQLGKILPLPPQKSPTLLISRTILPQKYFVCFEVHQFKNGGNFASCHASVWILPLGP